MTKETTMTLPDDDRALPTGRAFVNEAASARDFHVKADREVWLYGGYRLVLRGELIAEIRRAYRTIEKPIKGKRYVAWRRTSKTPTYNIYWPHEGYRGRPYHYRTLRAAVQDTIAQAIEARSAKTEGLGPQDESAVHAPEATPET